MRVRWSAQASSDLVRLHAFLAQENRQAAGRVVRLLRNAPTGLRDHPRLGPRVTKYTTREVRRLVVGEYELRYELRNLDIVIISLWHTREDR